MQVCELSGINPDQRETITLLWMQKHNSIYIFHSPPFCLSFNVAGERTNMGTIFKQVHSWPQSVSQSLISLPTHPGLIYQPFVYTPEIACVSNCMAIYELQTWFWVQTCNGTCINVEWDRSANFMTVFLRWMQSFVFNNTVLLEMFCL